VVAVVTVSDGDKCVCSGRAADAVVAVGGDGPGVYEYPPRHVLVPSDVACVREPTPKPSHSSSNVSAPSPPNRDGPSLAFPPASDAAGLLLLCARSNSDARLGCGA
jgi:hypothetical protein